MHSGNGFLGCNYTASQPSRPVAENNVPLRDLRTRTGETALKQSPGSKRSTNVEKKLLPKLFPNVRFLHKTGKCTYNTEALSCNHRCRRKAMSITHSGFLFVDLGIQHAMHKSHIVICGLSDTTVFFHICKTKGTIFEKKELLNIKCVF